MTASRSAFLLGCKRSWGIECSTSGSVYGNHTLVLVYLKQWHAAARPSVRSWFLIAWHGYKWCISMEPYCHGDSGMCNIVTQSIQPCAKHTLVLVLLKHWHAAAQPGVRSWFLIAWYGCKWCMSIGPYRHWGSEMSNMVTRSIQPSIPWPLCI